MWRTWSVCGVASLGLLLGGAGPAQAQDPGQTAAEAQARTEELDAIAAVTRVYEGERTTLGGFVTTDEFGRNPAVINWAVASGQKGVNVSYARGGTMTWRNVNGGSGGAATLAFQYANGGADDRFMRLEVNGVVVASAVRFLTGRRIASRNDAWWGVRGLQTVSVQANLNPGTTNTVRFVATQSLAPHIDFMRVSTDR